jgi:hypothetical protein
VSGGTVSILATYGLGGGGSVEYRYVGTVSGSTYSGTVTLAFSDGSQQQGTFSVTRSGTPSGAGVTFLRPADFRGGTASITLPGLGAGERAAVIPVYATQELDPDSMSYSISTQGIIALDLAAPSEPEPLSREDELLLDLRQERLRLLEEDYRLVSRLLEAGVEPLATASGEVRRLDHDKCPPPYVVGTTTCQFHLRTGAGDYEQITATVRHESGHALWFVQNQDSGEFGAAELRELARVYEEELLPSNHRYFGDPLDLDGNGKTFIVFSRLVGAAGNLGYVSYVDFFLDVETALYGMRSNEADLFYAATPGSVAGLGITRAMFFSPMMPATLVHELKHLITLSARIPHSIEESWWEEGAAQAAQELAGYGTQIGDTQRYARRALAAPQSLRLAYRTRAEMSAEEALSMYGYNFLMLWRIAERVGHDDFWKRWTAGPMMGIANIEAVTGVAYPELMLDFATTLLLDDMDAAYDFESLSLRDGSWEPLGTHALRSAEGSARSMAYYLGNGSGSDATITIRSNHARPYAVVVRFPSVSAGALGMSLAKEASASGS